MLDRKELIVEAQVIYEGCAPDMVEFELEDAAAFVADQLWFDNNGNADVDFYGIALEALKGYF